MKKNTRLLMAVIFIVVLLGVALTIVLLLPADTQRITTNDNNEILLFDKSGLLAESITVDNQGGSYELLAYEYEKPVEKTSVNSMENVIAVPDSTVDDSSASTVELLYTMQEYPTRTLDQNMTNDLAAQCQQMTARELIDRSGQKYADYGLAQPRSTVTVRYSDAAELTFYIGKDAPDNKGAYVRIEGDRNVYLVHSSQVEAFFLDKLQLFDKNLTGSMEDVKSLRISGSHYPEEIFLTVNQAAYYPVSFLMETPLRIGCDSIKTALVTNSACLVQAIWVTAIDITEKDLQQYGLSQPFEQLDMEGEDGNSIHLLASEKDSDGKIYLMKAGDDTIYQTYAAEHQWYGIEATDFLPDAVFKVQTEEIQSLQLTADSKTTDYRLSKEKSVNDNYYEAATLTLTADGEEIAYSGYSIFVANLCEMKRLAGEPDVNEKGLELLRAVFTYFDDPEVTDTLCLYRLPSGKTIAVLNDQLRCYVDSTYVYKLLQQVPQITGGTLPEDLTGSSDSSD